MNNKITSRIKPLIFYIVFFLFILGFTSSLASYDFDLWARLIAGMGFVNTGHVLKQDFLSYTPTHTWYDHEWGSGVVFYLTQHFFSQTGLLVLQAVLVFLIFFFITKIVELRGVKTTSAYNFLFYYFSFIAISYISESIIRCQMFSFLFFAVFLYILELARKENNKPLWLMPFLMIIWNNLHGGCVSGIGLIVLYIIGEFLNKKPVKKYIYALLATSLVLPINPWGFDYLKFLFIANTMQRADVVEWWGLFSKHMVFEYMKFKIYALILLLFELGVMVKKLIPKVSEFDKTKFLVVATTLYLAFAHVKLIPFSVITMAAFLYDDFYTAFNFITRNFFEKIATAKEFAVYSLILVFAFANIKIKPFKPLTDLYRYPVLPVEFIKINEIKGNILTNFGFGSYVSYKLYPNVKIFTDGRYEEVYYPDLMVLLGKYYRLKPGWDEILEKYPPDIIIVEKYYPNAAALLMHKEYKSVFEDKIYHVFVKTKMAKKTYKKPSTNLSYYKKTLFDTNIDFMLQSNHER